MAGSGKQVLRYFLGKCLPSIKQNAVKVCVPRFELDQRIYMYFKEHDFIYAHDPDKKCNVGDIVLIQLLPEKLTRLITHKVIDVIYPLGDITDPITGKKVVVGKYRNDIKEANQLFGESKNAFDYDRAPPRGITKDRRDFTYQETYVKYHEDPNIEEPYGV
ncbi:28S ribosomal protein S17, mitochondrial-like [Vespa mandarinia]|uniref:28S ribosomal protein S17, mitochondrial-like n=1 Tax=Vespa mandarinia TaxID=7446 RepID=UPI001618596D|nr:28S ribosomal protein S17, mitochondrial-like [Vespa mandarinia]